MTFIDLFSILPLIALIVWALLMLLAGLFLRKGSTWIMPLLAVIGLAGVIALTLNQAGKPMSGFGGMLSVDGFSVFLDMLFDMFAFA